MVGAGLGQPGISRRARRHRRSLARPDPRLEQGGRCALRRRRAPRSQLALFRLDVSHERIQDPVTREVLATGRSKRQGINVDADVKLSRTWNVFLDGTVNDAPVKGGRRVRRRATPVGAGGRRSSRLRSARIPHRAARARLPRAQRRALAGAGRRRGRVDARGSRPRHGPILGPLHSDRRAGRRDPILRAWWTSARRSVPVRSAACSTSSCRTCSTPSTRRSGHRDFSIPARRARFARRSGSPSGRERPLELPCPPFSLRMIR